MTRWGKDNEERAAVAQKAQDAYATARQAKAVADNAMFEVQTMKAELLAALALVDRLRAAIDGPPTPPAPIRAVIAARRKRKAA